MKDIPSAWVGLILIGASFRIWHLLAEDTILDRPRNWLVRLPRGWEEGQPVPKEYRLELAKFITCPWCLGAWITGAVWLLWVIDHDWTTFFCVPLALMAGLVLLKVLLDRLAVE